ncbi:DNA-binding protein [Brevibacillus laterosporus]|uniref:DNA-binding protein n=1 Tax=Brevibacillus laterosporus TaxID=1465 RepID=UPI003D1EC606
MTELKKLATSPIRAEIEHHLKSYNYTLSKLSELTNINAGHLSGFLKGHKYRKLTLDQLNAIGQVFEKPDGWLFDSYVEECLNKEKVTPKRVKSYLVKCAELGRYDCVQLAIPRILERPDKIDIFFSVAEHLYYKGRQKESIFFYQLVVDNRKNDHTESVIMSRYRLFQMPERANVEMLWKAVLLFEPFRKGLSEHCQLDALLQLGNHCCTLRRWKEVEKFADELLELANFVYKVELSKKKKGNGDGKELLNLESHLVAYYGQGYLLKAVSLEKQGLYEEAKEFVSSYADLSWFELFDESGQAEVAKYKKLALLNMCRLNLLMGDTSILPDFVEFLEYNPTELLFGFITIVESANKYGFSIDTILDKFSKEINYFDNYHDSASVDRNLQFRYQLAIYHLRNKRPNSGVKEILRCMTLSTVLNSSKDFIRCVALFEAYRHQASAHQEIEYKKIMEEVMRDERLIGRSHPHSEERPTVKH